MVGPVYPACKALAKRIHRIILIDTETGPLGCQSVFQSVGYPAQNRHLQKPYQPSATTLGTGLQSTG